MYYKDTTAVSQDSSTIMFCPRCGAENYIGPRTVGGTTGIIYCVKCGEKLM